jgi:hypothetical protein
MANVPVLAASLTSLDRSCGIALRSLPVPDMELGAGGRQSLSLPGRDFGLAIVDNVMPG